MSCNNSIWRYNQPVCLPFNSDLLLALGINEPYLLVFCVKPEKVGEASCALIRLCQTEGFAVLKFNVICEIKRIAPDNINAALQQRNRSLNLSSLPSAGDNSTRLYLTIGQQCNHQCGD